MFKLLVPALLCASVAAPALAETSAETINFSRNGQKYVATVETKGDITVISGYETMSGERFRLQVVDGKVRGVYGRSRVAFHTPTAMTPTVTASR